MQVYSTVREPLPPAAGHGSPPWHSRSASTHRPAHLTFTPQLVAAVLVLVVTTVLLILGQWAPALVDAPQSSAWPSPSPAPPVRQR